MATKMVRLGPYTSTGEKAHVIIPEITGPIAAQVCADATSFDVDIEASLAPHPLADGLPVRWAKPEETITAEGLYAIYTGVAAVRIDVDAIVTGGGEGVWVDLLYYERGA